MRVAVMPLAMRVVMVMVMTFVRLRMIVVVVFALVVLVRHWPLPFQILVDDFDELFGGEHLW